MQQGEDLRLEAARKGDEPLDRPSDENTPSRRSSMEDRTTTDAVTLTAKQLSEALQIGESTIWKYVRAGHIPSITVGAARRFILPDVLDALREASASAGGAS